MSDEKRRKKETKKGERKRDSKIETVTNNQEEIGERKTKMV